MIKCFGFLLFICNAGIVVGVDREFGRPIFQTFSAHDYGAEVGQIFAIMEDPQGHMLFGCEDAILVFDGNDWETIPTPGTGFVRSFAADSRGVVWFSSSTQIGYLSRVDGEYRVVKAYEDALGVNSRVLVNGDHLYFTGDTGFVTWNNGHISKQPWPSGTMNKFSAAVVHGKIWAGDRNGSIYELDGDRFNKIAESPPNNAGDVEAIVDCPIDDEGVFELNCSIVPGCGFTTLLGRTLIIPLIITTSSGCSPDFTTRNPSVLHGSGISYPAVQLLKYAFHPSFAALDPKSLGGNGSMPVNCGHMVSRRIRKTRTATRRVERKPFIKEGLSRAVRRSISPV